MKRTLAFLLLSAMPVAALAQPVPVNRGVMPVAGNPHAQGITVNASSSSSIAATKARIQLSLTSATNTATLDKDSIQPLVDALIKAGADPASVDLPPGFSAGGNATSATLTVTVPHPTEAMMHEGIAAVGAAMMQLPKVRLSGANVMLSANDCSAAIDKARSGAIAAARSKARAIASDLGVGIGNVLSVTSNEGGNADGTCATQYYVGPGGTSFPAGSSNNSYVAIPVMSYINITFAIK